MTEIIVSQLITPEITGGDSRLKLITQDRFYV